MTLLISLLPIVLYFLLIKGLDGFSFAGWGKILECFAWGLFSCLMRFLTISSPVLEECIKALPLFVAVHRERSAFFSEGILYGAAAGAGFAFMENIIYITQSYGFTIGDAIVRGFGTSILHVGCTVLCVCLALLLHQVTYRWRTLPRILILPSALIPSCVLHMLYNMFLFPEFMQAAAVILIVTVIVLIIYDLDNKLIAKWLDNCICNDVSLLKSIREGTLRETNAGRYLVKAREHFRPEVFFDICVYLGLYLELSIAAKSRMIMKEAGFDTTLTAEEHQNNMERIAELSTLRKSIGKAGVSLLTPLINPKAVDNWTIGKLL